MTILVSCMDKRLLLANIFKKLLPSMYVIRNPGNGVVPYKRCVSEQGKLTAFPSVIAGMYLIIRDHRHILIMGHSDCKANAAYMDFIANPKKENENLPPVGWMESICGDLKSKFQTSTFPSLSIEEKDSFFCKHSVLQQKRNLLSWPFINERVTASKLFIHPILYNIETQLLHIVDEGSLKEKPINNEEMEYIVTQ